MNKWTESQQKAIGSNGSNLIVSASAGSGKTAVLVERVVNHVVSGGDVRRLVVLTFTKDSAREMRERVLQELLRRVRLNPENEHLKEQADCLIFANITTIDGYCLELVKRYFNELDEEASADVLGEDEQEILLSDAADEAIDAFFEDGDETFYALIDRFIEQRDIKKLKEVIFSLHRFLGVQAEKEAFVSLVKRTLNAPFEERSTTKYLLSKLKRRAAKYRAATEAQYAEIPIADNNLRALVEATLAELAELSAAPDFRAFARTAESIESVGMTFRADRVKKEFPEEYRRLKDLRDGAKRFLTECRDDYRDLDVLVEKEDSVARFSLMLLTLATQTDLSYARMKREKGKLDFTDVERLCYRILSDEERRNDVRKEIDAIYLDEYQDTNLLQESILLRLSNGGNLFMVGDPKQAIYRFRLAEPAIFVGKYHRYKAHDGGEKVDLNENFRSDPRILEFVNRFFEDLMTEGFGGVDYKTAAWLKSGKSDVKERYAAVKGRPVELCLYELPKKISEEIEITSPYSVKRDGDVQAEARDAEGLRIAAKIKEIFGQPIYDGKLDAVRPIRYRDIAVIAPKNKNAAELRLTLLKRGIPATLAGRGKESENPDVLLLNAFLAASDNLRSDVPLLTVLASPLGGLSAEELSEIRLRYDKRKAETLSEKKEVAADSALNALPFDSRPTGNGSNEEETPRNTRKKSEFWEAVLSYSGNCNVELKLKELLSKLETIRLRSAYLTVPELLMETLRLTEYDAYLMGEADGAERLQKLNLYVRTLADKEYAFRLKDYLQEAADLPNDLQPPAADGDAVKVMTFHASKGLEFPVVFAAHVGDSGRSKQTGRTFFDKEFGIAVQYFEKATSALQDTVITRAFREKEKNEQREESLRLIYVALTRAKNRLYVVGKRGKSPGLFAEDGSSFASWFEYAAEKNPDLYGYLSVFREDEESLVAKPFEAEFGKEFQEPNLNFRYPHSSATELGVKYTVSELNAEQDEDFVPVFQYGEGGGREEGILYHKVFQYLDFSVRTVGDAEKELSRMVAEGVLDSEERAAIDVNKILAATETDLFRAAAAGKTLREQPFMLYLSAKEAGVGDSEDKILIQGVIDLMIFGKDAAGADEITLVDYKDTALDRASATKKYGKQISLYALAAEKILGIPVRKKLLYLVNRNEFVAL